MVNPTTKPECEQHLRELDALDKNARAEMRRVESLIAGQRRTVLIWEKEMRLTERARARTTAILKKLEKGDAP